MTKAQRQPIAQPLNGTDEQDQHEDHGDHHMGFEPLIAVADREVTKPSCADGAGHGRSADAGAPEDGKF